MHIEIWTACGDDHNGTWALPFASERAAWDHLLSVIGSSRAQYEASPQFAADDDIFAFLSSRKEDRHLDSYNVEGPHSLDVPAPALLGHLQWAIGLAEEAILLREGDDEDDDSAATALHRESLIAAHKAIAATKSTPSTQITTEPAHARSIFNYFCAATYCTTEGCQANWSITVRAIDSSAALVEARKWLDRERPGATKVNMTATLDRYQEPVKSVPEQAPATRSLPELPNHYRLTEANAETAMCLWEAMLEIRDRPDVAARFEEVGTVAMRHAVMALIPDCEREWEEARSRDEDHSPYDWEWCPAFLGRSLSRLGIDVVPQ